MFFIGVLGVFLLSFFCFVWGVVCLFVLFLFFGFFFFFFFGGGVNGRGFFRLCL